MDAVFTYGSSNDELEYSPKGELDRLRAENKKLRDDLAKCEELRKTTYEEFRWWETEATRRLDDIQKLYETLEYYASMAPYSGATGIEPDLGRRARACLAEIGNVTQGDRK